ECARAQRRETAVAWQTSQELQMLDRSASLWAAATAPIDLHQERPSLARRSCNRCTAVMRDGAVLRHDGDSMVDVRVVTPWHLLARQFASPLVLILAVGAAV